MRVEGLEGQFYVHGSLTELLPLAEQGKLKSTVTSLLSPFDPVVWDRRRALELFNFDYRLECYTPKENAAMATSPCRCCIGVNWWGALTPRRTAAGVFEIISFHAEPRVRFGKRRARIFGRPSRVWPNGTARNASRWATFRRRWPLNGVPAGKWDNERRRRWGKTKFSAARYKGLSG